jgi:hypothetical protein
MVKTPPYSFSCVAQQISNQMPKGTTREKRKTLRKRKPNPKKMV